MTKELINLEFFFTKEKLSFLQTKTKISANQYFFYYEPKNKIKPIAKEGYKIHISASYNNFAQVFFIASQYLIKKNMYWKHIKDFEILKAHFQKDFDLEQAGKLITVYTYDYENALEIAYQLEQKLKSFRGLEIVSSQAIKPASIVHYRYGKFSKDSDFNDLRKPYFLLPKNIKPLHQYKKKDDLLLFFKQHHFQLKKIISINNFGSVFLVEDQKKNLQIVKMARPYAGNVLKNKQFVSAITYLQNEKKLWDQAKHLQRFQSKIISAYWIANHYLLIKAFLPYLSSFEIKTLTSPSTQRKFCASAFSWIFLAIIEITNGFWKENYAINDLTWDNFIFNFEKQKVYLIDTEDVIMMKLKNAKEAMAFKNNYFPKDLAKAEHLKEIDLQKMAYMIIEWICFDLNAYRFFLKSDREKQYLEFIFLALEIPKTILDLVLKAIKTPKTVSLSDFKKLIQNLDNDQDNINKEKLITELKQKLKNKSVYFKKEGLFSHLHYSQKEKDFAAWTFEMILKPQIWESPYFKNYLDKYQFTKFVNELEKLFNTKEKSFKDKQFNQIWKTKILKINGLSYLETEAGKYSPNLFSGSAFISLLVLIIAHKHKKFNLKIKKIILETTFINPLTLSLKEGLFGYLLLLQTAFFLTKDKDFKDKLDLMYCHVFLRLETETQKQKIRLYNFNNYLWSYDYLQLGVLFLLWDQYQNYF